MIVPPTPLQEHARLASLYAYDILDTPAEPSFDALTRLAARVSDAPVSLITLIDARRQWFKSCHGLALTETGRDVSFCGHVVADERPLVVPDTLNDERFHDNPFVTSAPFVRFYAGAPLCAPSGHVLGTICVVDYVPRELTREQQELLELLAQQALALLELRRSERAAHSCRLALETLDKQVREAAASAEGGLASSDDAPASARSTLSLAAGIGHEINNPLTYVLANVGLALEHVRTLAPEHARPLEELLVDVRSGAERIRAIVQGLQALGRDARPPARVAVRTVVDAALEMARHELRERASLSVALVDPLPLLWVDEPRAAQALANLLVNAAQAFGAADPSLNHVWLTAQVTPEGRVAVSVRDNGPGIPADAQARLLEPFYSTTSSRLGLGLPIAHGIIARAGGTLSYETTEGVGSTFRVELPAAPPAELGSPRPSLRARVLVVDDDAAVLRAVARLLSQQHEVVALQDPEAALEHIRSGARFDVVFCDVLMPALSGLDLYAQSLPLWPAAAERFVFMSGGVLDEAFRARLAAVPNALLEKPVAGRQLREVVQRLVDPAREVYSPKTSSGV